MGKEHIKKRIHKTKKRRHQKNVAITKSRQHAKKQEGIKTIWKNVMTGTSNVKENIENIKIYYRNLAGHIHFSDYMDAEPIETFKEAGYPKEKILRKSIIKENWPLLSILDDDTLKKEMKRVKNRSTIWVRDPQHRSKIKEERSKQKKEKKKRAQLAKEAKAREGHTTNDEQKETTKTNNTTNNKEEATKEQKQKNHQPKTKTKEEDEVKKNNNKKEVKAGKKRKRPAAVAAALEEVSFDSVISRENEQQNVHTARRKKISNVRLLKQMEDATVTEEEKQALSMASAMRTAVSGRDKRSASVLRSKIKRHAQRKKSASKKWNERNKQLDEQKANTIARKQTNLANKKTRGRREGFEGKKSVLNSMSKIKKVLRSKKIKK